MRYSVAVFVCLVLGYFPARLAFGDVLDTGLIFGVKSRGSDRQLGVVPGSIPPSHLFSFSADGSAFNDRGPITVDGADTDVDGLAGSSIYGLLGFQLDHTPLSAGNEVTGSTLVAIEPDSAAARVIGPTLPERDIRGAVFDLTERLLVIDAAHDSVLEIDAATGSPVEGTEVLLTLDGRRFELSDSSDLAQRRDGTVFLVSVSSLYTLDTFTGVLKFVRDDPGQALSGAAFSLNTDADYLFVYEVNNFEDIFRYELNGDEVPRTTVFEDIINRSDSLLEFNAGRGDLAAVPLSAAQFMRGDANGDKVVDVSDAITILGLLFRGVPEKIDCEKAADVDDSGSVEITDAVFLLRFLFSGGAEIPAPTDCGPDSTPDDLTCESFPSC